MKLNYFELNYIKSIKKYRKYIRNRDKLLKRKKKNMLKHSFLILIFLQILIHQVLVNQLIILRNYQHQHVVCLNR